VNPFSFRTCLYGSLKRGKKLPAYRHYRLDGAGNIREAEWLEASDDEDAVTQVKALALPVASEIWERNRRVARVEPGSPG